MACDSGPVHLAAALGIPALVLFGPTSAVRWAPPPPGRALSLGLACQPCSNHGGERCPLGHHDCLRRLEVGAGAGRGAGAAGMSALERAWWAEQPWRPAAGGAGAALAGSRRSSAAWSGSAGWPTTGAGSR